MKKRLLLATFTTCLFIQPIFTNAATTPKAGTKCTNLGKSQIIGTYKYTCVKNGNKLIWNATRVVIKPSNSASPNIAKPEVVASATPTPSPTASPTILPSPTATINSKKMPQTSDDLHFRGLLFKAWQEQLDLKNPAISANIKYFIDPSFPKTSLNAIQEGLNNVLRSYGYLMKPNTKLNLIFSSSYDFEMESIKNDPEMYQDYLKEDPNWSRHTWRIDQYKQAQVVAGGTYPINDKSAYVIYFRLNSWNNNEIWRYLGAHEGTHLIQWMINNNFPQLIPAWWIEGQAQQVAEVIGNAKQTTESIDDEMLRLKGDYGPGFMVGAPDGLDLTKMEGDPVNRTEFGCELCGTHLIYTRGKLAIDYLIATYGHEQVINFMKSLNLNNLWWQSFEKSFGISVPQFYSEVQKLIVWYGDYYS